MLQQFKKIRFETKLQSGGSQIDASPTRRLRFIYTSASGGTVAEHRTTDPEMEGFNPADAEHKY